LRPAKPKAGQLTSGIEHAPFLTRQFPEPALHERAVESRIVADKQMRRAKQSSRLCLVYDATSHVEIGQTGNQRDLGTDGNARLLQPGVGRTDFGD
jgi:hypothetical protein